VPTAASYARATLAEVVGPALATATQWTLTTSSHRVFLNRLSPTGTGTFASAPLPPEAQLAPAWAVVVADLDGDTHDDLVLSQNLFPTELATPRYDAGRALWLRGDGTGRFTPVAAAQSGLAVYGDQRGAAAADYDQDGRLDLVLTQNGAATTLWHNQTAPPALRVRLVGPPGNPAAYGATLQPHYGARRGPRRLLTAASGYWSQADPVQLLAQPAQLTALTIHWPHGPVQTLPLSHPLPPTLVLRAP
jgi:hypothetical protein